MKKHAFVPLFLFVTYIILFTVLAIHPYERNVWLVENLTVWAVVIPLVILYQRGIRFSAVAYILMSIFIFMHTIGGHYTFALVPFDWFNHFFGFERNMYDRIAHFAVGFYALPIYEYMQSRKIIANAWVRALFALCIIISIAALYELFEWQYAVLGDPKAGLEVLGSQGDIWDAQKDMLSDTLGAIVVLLGVGLKNVIKRIS